MKKAVETTPYNNLPTCLALAFLLFLCPALHSQNQEQELLLKEAYSRNSEYDLYRFFDNWSKEVTSNETEAPDKWVAEAHKVFVAFYQPLLCGENGFQNKERQLYKDNPYFIVQNTLRSIYVADTIPYKNGLREDLEEYYTNHINKFYSDGSYRKRFMEDKEYDSLVNKYGVDSLRKKDLQFLKYDIDDQIMFGGFISNYSLLFTPTFIPSIEVDSNITFRPPVHFADRKIVYLTDEYKKLLDDFLGDKHVKLGEKSIMQPAYSKGKSRKKMEFILKAATIFYGHWGGYWQYETYPKARTMVFDRGKRRAVVFFSFKYEGGYVILEKQNGEWKIATVKYTWIE